VSWLLLIHTEAWLAMALSVVGVTLGGHFAYANRRDLAYYRERGWNGFAELAARQSIRSGRAKAGLHLMLLILPIIGLTGTVPPGRYAVAIVFYAALGAGQALVVRAQVLNVRDRRRLIRKLAARPASEEPKEKYPG
jgi:hypothetical protein